MPINSFTTDLGLVYRYDPVTVRWNVTDADTVQFRKGNDLPVGVPLAGTFQVPIEQPVQLSLIATKDGVDDERTLDIMVMPVAQIESVSAEPTYAKNPGDDVVLSWTTEGVDEVGMESRPGRFLSWDTDYENLQMNLLPSSTPTVNPQVTTTYKIIVANPRGTHDIYITVGVGEEIVQPVVTISPPPPPR